MKGRMVLEEKRGKENAITIPESYTLQIKRRNHISKIIH